MKKGIVIVMFMTAFIQIDLKSQVNLVPNPSFEMNDSCPFTFGQYQYTNFWFQPTWGSTDYFNSCDTSNLIGVPLNYMGSEWAHSGSAYYGICVSQPANDSAYNSYREYCEIRLDSPLVSGVKYYVSFFVSLADSFNYATDDLGALLSIDTIKNDTGFALIYTPQIVNASGNWLTTKSGWFKIFGSFVASGGEQFVTIGNFQNWLNTDTISVSGGSSNLNQPDWWSAYYYLDDICVSSDSTYCANWTSVPTVPSTSGIHIYPNPSRGLVQITGLPINATSPFSVYDVLGQNILSGELHGPTDELNLSSIAKGMYYLTFLNYKYTIIINE